ncbi:MAG: hypothetical protein JO021_08445 [Alphaproteobacteria bacterium]|nr:hypothetical protein [Alphaproteobacteria bacterium]
MLPARDNPLVTLRDAARRLEAAAVRVAPPFDAAAWQDGLDLLAVAAGLKPVCLLGRGDVDLDWLAGARAVAAGLSLAVQDGVGWLPAAPDQALPRWYRCATAARLRAAPVVYVYADPRLGARIAALAAAGRIGADEEAGLLGYPPCCVAQHHRQTLALEQLTIALLARIAGDDTAHLQRLVAAGVQPTPREPDEWRRFHAVTAIDPEPFTSINRCTACAVDLDTPAAQMGRAYRALAEQLDYLPPPSLSHAAR